MGSPGACSPDASQEDLSHRAFSVSSRQEKAAIRLLDGGRNGPCHPLGPFAADLWPRRLKPGGIDLLTRWFQRLWSGTAVLTHGENSVPRTPATRHAGGHKLRLLGLAAEKIEDRDIVLVASAVLGLQIGTNRIRTLP